MILKTQNVVPCKKKKSLFGIPLAVKDLIDVKGLPTTYGVPKYKNNVAKKIVLLLIG